MKKIVLLVILVFSAGLFSSCEKDKDSEIVQLQGIWESKNSVYSYSYTKIGTNSISFYHCSHDPDYMSAGFEFSMSYVYNEKTKIISATLEGETEFIEVVELTSSSLTLRSGKEYLTLTRVKTQNDLAPKSVVGMTLGAGTYNFRLKNNNTMEVIDPYAHITNTEILGEASYIYTKTGINTAILEMQFKERSQPLNYLGYEHDVNGNLNLNFEIPNIGMIKSGKLEYNGFEYRITNGEWLQYAPYNTVTDFYTYYFILK